MYDWFEPLNLVLSQGDKMIEPDKKLTNYYYRFISFADIDFIHQMKDPSASDEGIKKLMGNRRNALIWMHSIGTHPDEPVNPKNDPDSAILNPGDAGKYDLMPCGIVTENGSIIPQPIIPSSDFLGIDNGLKVEDDTSNAANQKGYNWFPLYLPDKLNPPSGGSGSSPSQDRIDPKKLFGIRDQYGWYVSNVNCGDGIFDREAIGNRKYYCPLNDTYCRSGSFAFCYSIRDMSQYGDGVDPNLKALGPLIKLILDAKNINEDRDLNGISDLIDGTDGIVEVVITPNGQIVGKVGEKYQGEGGLSSPENDMLPRQSLPRGFGTNPTLPLFMYPTYYGLVITNSISKSTANGSNQVLVPYSSKGDYRQEIRIFSDEGFPDYIRRNLNEDKSAELKWFPTLVQESGDPTGIRLSVKSSERMVIGDNITLLWTKCLGNFAYCPLYFHRNLEFTVFFKGFYAKDESESGNLKYLVYPVACPNINGKEMTWDGVSEKGSDPMTISFRKGSRNCRVCNDSKLKESIYRADFRFRSDKLLRYPVEAFGFALVFRRSNASFDIRSGNGDFDICKSNPADGMIIPQFTKARELQGTDFPANSNGGSSSENGGHGNGVGSLSKKRFFSLITSCNVQSGLDGVSGSLTLDAYPLAQGIRRIVQEQSVGELDIDVSYADLPDYSVPGHNPNPSIFKGYGMEISTNDSADSYSIGVNLQGVQRKLSDIKLITCPFWDGNRLESVCAYFQSYANVKLNMLSDKSGTRPQPVDLSSQNSYVGTWKSSGKTILSGRVLRNLDFRLPRSWDWRSPAVTFQDGTACLDALKEIGMKCGCVFLTGMDGEGYFMEINRYGFPYYVHNQIDEGKTFVIEPADIISISLSPELERRYNTVVTIGFLQKKVQAKNGKVSYSQSVKPGILKSDIGGDRELYPWSRPFVQVEKGFLTNSELQQLHDYNTIMVTSDIYKGSVTVPGNTRINLPYQVITILGIHFFVMSIDHSIDTSSKSWTTSYQLYYFDPSLFNGDW